MDAPEAGGPPVPQPATSPARTSGATRAVRWTSELRHGRRRPGAHLVETEDCGQIVPVHADDTLTVIAGEPSVSTPSLDGPRNRDR